MPIIEGTYGPFAVSGVPSNGTDAVFTLTFAAGTDGGTFKLAKDGYTTAAISWSSTNNTLIANIDAALEALPNVPASGVTTAVGTMTNGIGTITVTMAGTLGKRVATPITVADDSLTGSGAEVTIEETTPGVTATGWGCLPGALAVDTDSTGKLYKNTSATRFPTWTAQT